ncbi:MAG: hypothetical protein R3E58_19510 [Phycisphaerae bacterium]
MSEYAKQLEANLQRIQDGIREASENANRRRKRSSWWLSRYATLDVLKAIVDLGWSELGESKAQG